jgi:VanZ family protein
LVDAVLAGWRSLPIAVRAVAPLAMMAFLWWSSSQSPASSGPNALRAFLHNGAHVLAYAGIAGASWLALPAAWERRAGPRAAFASIALAVAYGVVDELHQSQVPGRVCSIADLLTDACGACLAVAYLRGRFGGAVGTARRLGGWLLACLASVLLATFGPW